ncbi:hypothetical protein [Streptomyces brevispora]|uniref:Uncharacterized protein n=1 Tax=Streptomyces brevispora TaxID=887462 RepID=A0ABZ1G1H5_9ACTN|nr:hypothetical protein [Streptomyces brevispora]WSC12588.1 hypothetical protein OIE64_06855 [Streptomyces brevispora]
MILPFTHDGEPGSVTVDLEQVDDPLTIGKHPPRGASRAALLP